MNIAYLFILAFAVSLDSFTVGITYGIRKVKIPFLSIFIITLASAVVILTSMQIGVLLSKVLPNLAELLGSIILISIGIWVIVQVLRKKNKHNDVGLSECYEHNKNRKREIRIEIKKIGLVIQILKTPMKADIDCSGIISPIEAMILGLALSLDAFGAGLGAAMIGFQPLVTAIIISGMSGLFVLLGIKTGFLLSGVKWFDKLSVLPGIFMIIIGLIKII